MDDRPTVLLPIRVLEGESIPDGIPELLAQAHIILLGYNVVPEQTPTGQAELQFEERASARLEEFADILESAGATVDVRLVFTHQAQQTLDRVNKEADCDAIVVPNATNIPERVLVPINRDVGVEQFALVVAGLFGSRDIDVTLYHVRGPDEAADEAEALLDWVADRLKERGLKSQNLEIEIDEGENPLDEIIATSADYDAVVIGETDPTLATFFFGMPAEQVAKRFLGPVIVVQRPVPPDEPVEE